MTTREANGLNWKSIAVWVSLLLAILTTTGINAVQNSGKVSSAEFDMHRDHEDHEFERLHEDIKELRVDVKELLKRTERQ
jgi:hypothetical protein